VFKSPATLFAVNAVPRVDNVGSGYTLHLVTVRSRSVAASVVAALFVAAASAFSTVAWAKPPTLHLSAIVYDTHASMGVFSSKEKVYQGATKVGEDQSRCTETSNTAVHCVGSYTLKHGTIKFSGTISNASDTNRLKITGGTGTYKGARGTVLTEYNKAGTRAKETLSFSS
jgi:hypothetical protein